MQQDFLELMHHLTTNRQPFAIATVVATQGSASAQVGAKALIDATGKRLSGWVGGGCADSQCRIEAQQAIERNLGRLIDVNMNDEVLGTGMPCGGTMQVFIDPITPAPRLWILGHGRIAEALCSFAKTLDFHVVVNDVMAESMLFPGADQIINDDLDYSTLTPEANDYVIIATQHKGDHDSLKQVLATQVGYVGLIASQKRAKLIIDFLQEHDFSAEQIERVKTPCGLNLAAKTPEEIALSVISEIIMVHRQGTGEALSLKGSRHGG